MMSMAVIRVRVTSWLWCRRLADLAPYREQKERGHCDDVFLYSCVQVFRNSCIPVINVRQNWLPVELPIKFELALRQRADAVFGACP